MTTIDDITAAARTAADLAAAGATTFDDALRSILTALERTGSADRAIHDARDTDVYSPPRSCYEALVNVAREVGPVAKEREVKEGQRYWFRGIDDIMNAIHAAMARNGVLPLLVDETAVGLGETDDRPWTIEMVTRGQNGSRWHHHYLRTRWRILGPCGDVIETTVLSESLDNQDKGIGKARSYGMKDLFLRLLTLPTDDPASDNEAVFIPPEPSIDDEARAAGFRDEAHRQEAHNLVHSMRRSISDEDRRRQIAEEHQRGYDKRWPITADELAEFAAYVEVIAADEAAENADFEDPAGEEGDE